MKQKTYFATILFLLLFCFGCQQEQFVEQQELTEQQKELFNEITSDHDYTILIVANSRIHYYLHKTKLSFIELKNFSENKGNILEYSKKINKTNINKGNIVYDFQIYKQLTNTIAKNYPLDCSDVLLRKFINNDLNTKTLKFIQESAEKIHSKTKYVSREYASREYDPCHKNEDCSDRQLCCRAFGTALSMCVNPVSTDYDGQGTCPTFTPPLDEVEIPSNGNDSNDYLGLIPDWFWKSRYDGINENNEYPYNDGNSNNNWFGGGRGGTNPDKPLDDDKIDTDDLRGRVKCVYDKMVNKNNSINWILNNFNDGAKPSEFDLKFVMVTNLPNHINGRTLPANNKTIVIKINANTIKRRTSLEIARTILHEGIHARLEEFGKRKGSNSTGFPGIYDYFRRNNKNTWSHQQMAAHYIVTISKGLKQYDNAQHSNQYYNDLAWNGLYKISNGNNNPPIFTDAWNRLTPSEKTRIKNTIRSEHTNGNKICN